MTTAPDHHEPFDAEPFSAEERELAARLGRLGPVDGPSAALDAKILAAAHAASAPRKPGRRRLAWLGVPPALVTGVGVAAAAVLVLGVVWQLRPQYGAVTAQSEADAGEEIILIAPPSDASSPQIADAAAAPAPVASPLPARAARPKAAPPPEARPASSPAPMSEAAASAPAPVPAPAADEAGALAPAAASADRYTHATDAAANATSSDNGFVETPPDANYRHATYTTAARAAAERRERSAAQKASAVASEAAPASEEEGTTLDRVQVTGSRIRGNVDVAWSEVPVSDDTHLAPIEWLERIRARRDNGDTDNARASLKLFQREYPRIRLPDELRALLVETKQ